MCVREREGEKERDELYICINYIYIEESSNKVRRGLQQGMSLKLKSI